MRGGFQSKERGGYARNNTSALTRNASDNAAIHAMPRRFYGGKKQIFQSGTTLGRSERTKNNTPLGEGPNELIAGLLRREGIQMVDSTHGSNCGDVCIIREGWGLQT